MFRKALMAMAALVLVQSAHSEVVQGRDYTLVTPVQATQSQGKIEVLEFFSYGCPHCAHFHPSVTKWAEALPADAVFVRVPVAFGRQQWGQLARAYYALQMTGDLQRLDHELFEAIHEEHKQLFNEQALTAWVASHGGNAAEFREAFNSSEVTAKAIRADQLSRAYRIGGVPQLAVNGKYLVIGRDFNDMLRIASELAEKERSTAAVSQR